MNNTWIRTYSPTLIHKIPVIVRVEERGFISAHSPEFPETILFTIRDAASRIVRPIVRIPKGSARTEQLDGDITPWRAPKAKDILTTYAAAVKDRLQRVSKLTLNQWVALTIEHRVPDQVMESVEKRCIIVRYGDAELLFFRGERLDSISEETEREQIAKDPFYQKTLCGKPVVSIITDEHRAVGRMWASKYVAFMPRPKDKPVKRVVRSGPRIPKAKGPPKTLQLF